MSPSALGDRGTAVYPEPKEGPQRVPEYKFGHFMKLPLMQLWATTTLFDIIIPGPPGGPFARVHFKS